MYPANSGGGGGEREGLYNPLFPMGGGGGGGAVVK